MSVAWETNSRVIPQFYNNSASSPHDLEMGAAVKEEGDSKGGRAQISTSNCVVERFKMLCSLVQRNIRAGFPFAFQEPLLLELSADGGKGGVPSSHTASCFLIANKLRCFCSLFLTYICLVVSVSQETISDFVVDYLSCRAALGKCQFLFMLGCCFGAVCFAAVLPDGWSVNTKLFSINATHQLMNLMYCLIS